MSVIVITGASAGIGRALALRGARAGYDIVAIGRNRTALDTLAEQVGSQYGKIVTASIDISDPANAQRVVALARERFGRIDVLVNNAGQVAVGALAVQTDDELRVQFGTHVIGPIALVREAFSLLRASQGHVFLVGSGVARVAVHGLGAYPPSKAAVRSAASILRRELKSDGIAVTYVDPGAVDTGFMASGGMAGAPASLLVAPGEVARQILLAIHTRPRVVNAVPWQTAFVALAEAFPQLTDTVLERNPNLVGIDAAPPTLVLASPTRALGSGSQPQADADAQASVRPADSGSALTDEPPAERGAPALQSSVREPSSPSSPVLGSPSTFDDALAPLERRMERSKLDRNFVRALLVVGDDLDPNEIALRWAGMPNKNERALTAEVLGALVTAGFLEHNGATFRVVRAPSP